MLHQSRELAHRPRSERLRELHHLVQHAPRRPHVRLVVVRLSLEHLGGHEHGGADERPRHGVGAAAAVVESELSRDAEIPERDATPPAMMRRVCALVAVRAPRDGKMIAAQEDVLRLQVPVQRVVRVQVLHAQDDLREPVQHDALGDAPSSLLVPSQQAREVAAGAVRHRDVHAPAVDEGLRALEHARVVRALHDGHLAEAHLALELLRRQLHLLEDDLVVVDGAADAPREAPREEYLAVSALADLPRDLVRAHDRRHRAVGGLLTRGAWPRPRASVNADDASQSTRNERKESAGRYSSIVERFSPTLGFNV
eukprot:31422-Pelagococcus_subviridis.AAC.21